jgi:hypothetical protein
MRPLLDEHRRATVKAVGDLLTDHDGPVLRAISDAAGMHYLDAADKGLVDSSILDLDYDDDTDLDFDTDIDTDIDLDDDTEGKDAPATGSRKAAGSKPGKRPRLGGGGGSGLEQELRELLAG